MKPFEQIVAEHGATVLRVCRAVLGPADADDAWSETFLAALRAYPALDADANVEAWLVTIAHRKAIDVIRAAGRAPIPVETLPESVSHIGVPGASDRDLWAALAALPPKQRQAVAYHYLVGLPHQTVAEILGGTTDAARRAASDGIKTLRLRLAEPLSLVEERAPASVSKLTGWSDCEERTAQMTATNEPTDTDVLAAAHEVDPADLARLHAALETAAASVGDLDLAYRTLESPVGLLLLVATEQGLVRVAFQREDHDAVLERLATLVSPRILRAPRRLDAAARELDEYFAGARHRFELALDHRLSKGFRRNVLAHLPEIGYGQTESYAQVALAAGSPRAVRAVGSACATNPLPLVVPCHRVVRSDGSFGGYLGGVEAKQLLLHLEGAA